MSPMATGPSGPAVSVVIPCYNDARFLGEAIGGTRVRRDALEAAGASTSGFAAREDSDVWIRIAALGEVAYVGATSSPSARRSV